MPIKINLLAEQIEERERRRRDPVKRALYVAGSIVALFVLFVGSLQWTIMSRSGEISDLEASFQKLESDYKKALTLENDIQVNKNKNQALITYGRERFLWAPVLDELQFTMVGNLKVIQVTGSQKFLIEKQKDNRLDKEGILEKAGSPGRSTEKSVFTIQALDYGNGGDDWNHFEFKSLVESRFKARFFQTPEEENEKAFLGKVTMQNLSSPLIDPITGVRFRNLEIDCEFPQITREDEIFNEELIQLSRKRFEAQKAAKREAGE